MFSVYNVITIIKSNLIFRVTGLDCAFPLFFPAVTVRRLSTEDALFVDTIHTDSKRLGLPLSEGHANFWPNGGLRPQPGCRVSNLFYSITYADAFNGKSIYKELPKFFQRILRLKVVQNNLFIILIFLFMK